jgi:hypothetical protein
MCVRAFPSHENARANIILFRERKEESHEKKMNIHPTTSNCDGKARTHTAGFFSLSTSISKAKITLTWMCEGRPKFFFVELYGHFRLTRQRG